MLDQEKIETFSLRDQIKSLWSLQDDKASDLEIDNSLRSAVTMRGTNLWVLMFAIFIASIGLNVNSTAVIIGAMLISPLMGPIMGIGYGLGIYDFKLIRIAFRNLAMAVSISLLTSVIYFLLTPLNQAQSELLARTTPTIWDVLIALFGGLAGIIGITRKEKSNVIPGVAIATALMPPICTAGYGIANGEWSFFFGAFYLFTINAVFIALSSALVIRLSHVETKHFIDSKTTSRVKTYAALLAIITVVPSIYLAFALVQDEVFKANASTFIEGEIANKKTYVSHTQIDPKNRRIEVTLIGEFIPQENILALSERLEKKGLAKTELIVHQTKDDSKLHLDQLKTGLVNQLYTQSQEQIKNKDERILQLETELQQQRQSLAQFKAIPRELQVLFPSVTDVWISKMLAAHPEFTSSKTEVLVLTVSSTKVMPVTEKQKMKTWLTERLSNYEVNIVWK